MTRGPNQWQGKAGPVKVEIALRDGLAAALYGVARTKVAMLDILESYLASKLYGTDTGSAYCELQENLESKLTAVPINAAMEQLKSSPDQAAVREAIMDRYGMMLTPAAAKELEDDAQEA